MVLVVTVEREGALRRPVSRVHEHGPEGQDRRPRGHRYYVVPVKILVRACMTESTCVCHTLCPSTAIVISSTMKRSVAVLNFICALPGDRFRYALTVAAIVRNFLIVKRKARRLREAAPVEAGRPLPDDDLWATR